MLLSPFLRLPSSASIPLSSILPGFYSILLLTWVKHILHFIHNIRAFRTDAPSPLFFLPLHHEFLPFFQLLLLSDLTCPSFYLIWSIKELPLLEDGHFYPSQFLDYKFSLSLCEFIDREEAFSCKVLDPNLHYWIFLSQCMVYYIAVRVCCDAVRAVLLKYVQELQTMAHDHVILLLGKPVLISEFP